MAEAKAVLVIGAHREELAFGERVAGDLPESQIEVYRIPEGISGRRPRPDESFRYRTCHRELYLQLRQQLKGRFRLLIDLHAGLDAQGPSADVLCRDRDLLRCIDRSLSGDARPGAHLGGVRAIPLVSPGESPGSMDGGIPAGHALIPPSVWAGDEPLYVALELYLREAGAGGPEDWRLARLLVRCVLGCAHGRP